MDDPKKEKDRMNFYGGWSDIFLDKKYEKLVSDAPTEEMWIALDKLKESLGKENLNRMLQAFIRSVLQVFLKDEKDDETKNSITLKLGQVKQFINA